MRASERAHRILHGDIVEWRLAPGTVLGEVEQATRLGVSRTPVREAFSRLLSEGLVEAKPGRGVVVSPVSAESVRAMFELRAALDAQAADLAARRGDPALFTDLARRLEAAAEDPDRAEDADRRAYYALVDRLDAALDAAVDSAYLVQAQRSLRVHLGRVRKLSKGDERRLRAAAAEHAQIARAVAHGDPELARACTRVHLSNSLAAILAAITTLQEETP
ncbi:GntR family transcriptional regulator [Rothia sp. AR01]|uniref:GntR family transcriptional regulator n=1 Tax=Rothia santali TaxID=2949643 RepID=A0A9X2KKQ1_9MICC|nr:GntR family transcriptional regulator [Rothia santali]MCP3425291.1 GntR family transcriptional regulator [Rothia santali]